MNTTRTFVCLHFYSLESRAFTQLFTFFNLIYINFHSLYKIDSLLFHQLTTHDPTKSIIYFQIKSYNFKSQSSTFAFYLLMKELMQYNFINCGDETASQKNETLNVAWNVSESHRWCAAWHIRCNEMKIFWVEILLLWRNFKICANKNYCIYTIRLAAYFPYY